MASKRRVLACLLGARQLQDQCPRVSLRFGDCSLGREEQAPAQRLLERMPTTAVCRRSCYCCVRKGASCRGISTQKSKLLICCGRPKFHGSAQVFLIMPSVEPPMFGT